MTDFEKAYWVTDGNNISVRMPIAKIDKSKRIVSGWATTDSVDKQGDIVNAEASAQAFERFRGNVREQHTPLAVGKVVSFKQDKYFDQESQNFYNGIYVDVYVSKGAEDTWHKINEGILTGFSIGGSIKDAEEVYNKDMDSAVRVIKDYDLYELSLVDNPANPNSNIVSVQKLVDGETEITKNFLENVYWCGSSDTVILSEKSSYSCPQCDKSMTNIGFVESNDVNKGHMVKDLIKSFNKSSDEQSDSTQAIDEQAKSIAENFVEKEGNTVGILNRKTTTTVVEETVAKSQDAEAVVEEAVEEAVAEETAEAVAEEVAEELEKSDEPTEETVEKADTAEEVVEEATAEAVEESTTPTEESNTDDLAKAVSEIKDSVADSLGDLAAVVKGLTEQVVALKKSLDGVTEEVNAVKGDVTKFGERVELVEADTAVRKSGDLGGIVQEENITEKSMWGGRFLKSADLYR
jgi:hypothetical protein